MRPKDLGRYASGNAFTTQAHFATCDTVLELGILSCRCSRVGCASRLAQGTAILNFGNAHGLTDWYGTHNCSVLVHTCRPLCGGALWHVPALPAGSIRSAVLSGLCCLLHVTVSNSNTVTA
jgi:hypothetical protein